MCASAPGPGYVDRPATVCGVRPSPIETAATGTRPRAVRASNQPSSGPTPVWICGTPAARRKSRPTVRWPPTGGHRRSGRLRLHACFTDGAGGLGAVCSPPAPKDQRVLADGGERPFTEGDKLAALGILQLCRQVQTEEAKLRQLYPAPIIQKLYCAQQRYTIVLHDYFPDGLLH